MLKKLQKFSKSAEPVKITGSGIKKASVTTLSDLGLVELVKIPSKTGKLPAKENGFRLSSKGIVFLDLMQSGDLNLIENVVEASKELSTTTQELNAIKEKITRLETSLSGLSKNLQQIKSRPVSRPQPAKTTSKSDITRVLVQHQKAAKREHRRGHIVSLETFYIALEEEFGYTTTQIGEILFKLYEEEILDLQMGSPPTSKSRGVKTPSGRTMNWGYIRN